MAPNHEFCSASADIPEPEGRVLARGQKKSCIRSKSYRVDSACMSGENPPASSALEIPQADRSVLPGRCKDSAVGADGNRVDRTFVPCHTSEFGAPRQVPYRDLAVPTAAHHEASVCTHCERGHCVLAAAEQLRQPHFIEWPQPNRPIVASRNDRMAIGVKCYSLDGSFVALKLVSADTIAGIPHPHPRVATRRR